MVQPASQAPLPLSHPLPQPIPPLITPASVSSVLAAAAACGHGDGGPEDLHAVGAAQAARAAQVGPQMPLMVVPVVG